MKSLTAWEKYKQNLGETRPWNIINPRTEYVEKEESERRYGICQECPELIQMTKTCKKCGCFMSAKTKLLNATCPIGKW
jgi:hypothetical protein